MSDKTCEICGKIIQDARWNRKFCNGVCQKEGYRLAKKRQHKKVSFQDNVSMRTRNLIGLKFGKLLVLRQATPPFDKTRNRMWVVRCDCGKEIVRATTDLVQRCRHCGCSFPKGEKSSTWLGFGGISGSRLAGIRQGNRGRKFPFKLTCEYLWNLYQKQQGRCAISGLPITIMPISKSRNNAIKAASLDRINSNLGYIEGNVQWTSLAVNIMKKDHNEDEFLMLCKSVVKHHNVKLVEEGEVKG